MSTASTPQAPTTGTVTCSWTASASTTTRPQVGTPGDGWWHLGTATTAPQGSSALLPLIVSLISGGWHLVAFVISPVLLYFVTSLCCHFVTYSVISSLLQWFFCHAPPCHLILPIVTLSPVSPLPMTLSCPLSLCHLYVTVSPWFPLSVTFVCPAVTSQCHLVLVCALYHLISRVPGCHPLLCHASGVTLSCHLPVSLVHCHLTVSSCPLSPSILGMPWCHLSIATSCVIL